MGPMGPPGAPGGHGEPPRGLPRPRGTRGRGPEPFLENPVFGSPALPRPTPQNCLKTGSPASGTYLNRSGLLFWSRWVPSMPQEPPRGPNPGIFEGLQRAARVPELPEGLPELPEGCQSCQSDCQSCQRGARAASGATFFEKKKLLFSVRSFLAGAFFPAKKRVLPKKHQFFIEKKVPFQSNPHAPRVPGGLPRHFPLDEDSKSPTIG